MYKYDVVLGSKITIVYTNPDGVLPVNTGRQQQIMVGVWPSTDSTAITASEQIYNQQYYRGKWLGDPSGNRQLVVVKHYMSTKKMFGRGKILNDYNFYESTSGAEPPANQWYWQLFMWNQTGGAPEADGVLRVGAQITVTYYVCFSNRQTLPAS